MQMSKVRVVSKLVVANKNFVRSAAVNTAAIRENAEPSQNLKSFKEIPGPPSLPFIGPILSFMPGGKLSGLKGVQLSERIYKLYGHDGIVRLNGFAGGSDMVWLFDANAVECVLRSENTMPIRPGFASLEYYRQRHNKVYDPKRQTGLISDHGENWKDFRSKVNHIMLQPKTIKLYTDVLEEVSNDMVAKVYSRGGPIVTKSGSDDGIPEKSRATLKFYRLRFVRDKNNMIKKKLDVEINLWALESIGVVALGTRLNCFDPNLPADSPARKLIQNVHDFFEVAEKVDFGASPWRLFATPMFKKAMKVYEEQESLTKFFIDQALKNMEESKSSVEKSNSEKPVLEKLLEIDVRVAHVMASDMLMAGVDTAANTALATFYLLATNPEKQNKLREEVLAKQSRKPYLRACIKESMRMLPVVNGNVRLSTKEYNLLGYKIPKNIMVVFSHQYMSSMEEHYPKPHEFIPERWLTNKDDPLYHGNTHPFVTSPFGYGVRMCIGRRIAELEMETFISKVIENFQLEWNGEPIQVTANALNYLTGPFNFVFKDL